MIPTRALNEEYPLMSLDDAAPWYRHGLAFTCTQCGDCCTGAPGFVWVDDAEIAQLAEFRGESRDDFGRQFLRRVGDQISLIERPNGDCIFWDRATGGCTVYAAPPGPVPDLAVLAR